MKPGGVLLLTVGIFLGIFPQHQVSSYPSSGTSQIRLGKTNGFAEYATHRPYKADFDLIRVSERSHELAMPLIFNNDIGGWDNDEAIRILASDPTLRSRRKRRQIPLSHQIFFGLNPGFSNGQVASASQTGQRHSALAVPSSSSAFFIPSSALSQPGALALTPAGGANVGRNELAILANYYQPQQLPPQGSPLQVGIFQGPLPNERQRPQLDGIHTNYPYPYPPTLDVSPQSPVVPESVGLGDDGQNGGATEYPADSGVVGGSTSIPEQQQQQQQQEVGQEDASPVSFPDSPLTQQSQEVENETVQTTEASNTASTQLDDGSLQQQIQLQDLAMQNRLREKDEEIRRLSGQLEQANLQVVSYEQESANVKEQFQRSEEANMKLRERVLQLENTNQHLQDQNGKLQQTANEQRQQINGLKTAYKEAKEQLAQNKPEGASPSQLFSKEEQEHRKEIEGFLIRIRKLGEENETCKKQVKLYQLKVSYIQEQQQNRKQQSKDKEVLVQHTDIVDDELDPELSRMDAEIAALQKRSDEVSATIKDLPKELSQLSGAIPESAVPAQVSEQKVVPPQAIEVKKESEFPGEAVQIPQRAQQPEQPAQKTVATGEDVGRSGAWEEPEGF